MIFSSKIDDDLLTEAKSDATNDNDLLKTLFSDPFITCIEPLVPGTDIISTLLLFK